MFKKSEESEWTRFSRALGNRDQQPETEETPQIEAPESLDAEPTLVVPPTPVEPPEQERVAAAQPAAEVRSPEPVAPPHPVSPPPPPQPVYAPAPAPPPAAASVAGEVAMSADDAPASEHAPEDEAESVLGDGTEVEGTLRCRHSIRILGSVQGEIESRGTVTVESDATVNARINAENINIKGVVNGDLTCPGRIEITDSGRLIGGISGGILVMHEGAYFEGSLKMSARRPQRDQETDARADAESEERPDSLTDEQL